MGHACVVGGAVVVWRYDCHAFGLRMARRVVSPKSGTSAGEDACY